jgi:putative spermidine/putrescine transport system substrate-binding protein
MKNIRYFSVLTAVMLMASACGSDSKTSGGAGSADTASGATAPTAIGSGEKALNLVVWAGYAEDGSTDPAYNWVKKFTDDTGCVVKSKTAATSDEMFNLIGTGQYDGVSASGDASVRLIDSGLVAPVNTALIKNYADISSFLKDQSYNSSGGKNYGIPHGWGANYLMYNSDVVSPAPDSWGAVFDKSAAFSGKVTAYDAPIYIADAALYLASAKPELGIKDPYSLKQNQFDAAVALLKDQHKAIGEYWNDYTKAVTAFSSGSTAIGTTWQIIYNIAVADNDKLKTVLPKEGTTGWSDTWMVASKAAHPNCMYMWMDYITSPDVQAQVATYFGEAPANPKACDSIAGTDATFCDVFKAKDASFAQAIRFWATPRKKCLDGSGTDCVPFSEWIKAWTEVKG